MTTLQKWPEECNVKFVAGDFANKCEDLELRGREKTLTCRNVIEVRGVQSGMKSGWNKSEDAKETTIECLKTGQNSDYKRRFKQSDVEKNVLKRLRGHRGDTAGVKMGVAVFSPCLLVVVDGCFSFLF